MKSSLNKLIDEINGEDHIEIDGCRGARVRYQDGDEFECDYEFPEENCEDCIFGGYGGTKDPRINNNLEELK